MKWRFKIILLSALIGSFSFPAEADIWGKIRKGLDKVENWHPIKPKPKSEDPKNVNSHIIRQGDVTIDTRHQDFDIKVKRCEASGTTCVVDLVLENRGLTDLKATVFGGNGPGPGFDMYHECCTEMYDDEGNKYTNTSVKVATGNAEPTAGRINLDLLSEVPIKMRIQIDGISESAKVLKRIDFNVNNSTWGIGSGDNRIKISNVPIFREG